ncbi:hypothetical protein EV363DRAFT_1171018, partial [Boletus edulis]
MYSLSTCLHRATCNLANPNEHSGNALLTDADRDNIRAFKLKLISNMPRSVYNNLRQVFRHKITLDSEWVILRRLALLSGIEPVHIDCCINSCLAFTRQYAALKECPTCGERRHTASGQARRQFSYLPIIPRLQAFFQNKAKVQLLLYRHRFKSVPGAISDIFDGESYRSLCCIPVTIDGVAQSYHYFNHKYDIALGLSVDSYLLF